MTGPKILTLDIETSPNLAHVWGLFNQNIGLPQLMKPGGVISFAAKWKHQNRVIFHSDHHDGHGDMVTAAWNLLNDADIVVHYNGARFDMPHLRREFAEAGFTPHAPVKQVDLLRVVKAQFRFASNKLDHVVRQLGIEGKVQHSGHDLWVRCLAGDPKAWATMKRYNMQDVRITERLYDRLLPWIKSHPNMGMWFEDRGACPRCGGTKLQKRGMTYTTSQSYIRYQCQDCGTWSRANVRTHSASILEDKT